MKPRNVPTRRKRTNVTVARDHGPEPRLPHERDESADSQAAGTQAREVGRKAFEDMAAGHVDTDLGPVLEELSRTQLQPAPRAPRRKSKAPR